MKQIIRFSFLLLAILLPVLATAHDFEVDGIYYKINGNEAAVTYRGPFYYSFDNEYSDSVVIPATVTYNGTTYPVTSIDNFAFSECKELTVIVIPNSVNEIGQEALAYCPGLTSIVVESSNPKYDSRNNCNAIIETASNTLIAGCKNTSIPNSVASIGNEAFYNCRSLTSIDIPNSVTEIGDRAFYGCTGLTSIDIPNSVASIGNDAFYLCTGLTSIVVESGNPIFDSRNNCNAIIETADNTLIVGCKNTTIPNTITAIGDWAFYFCHGLTSIDIPNSVTSIGFCAFNSCLGLTSVNLGNSITEIGGYAFEKCQQLTSIDIPNSVTSIGERAFNSCWRLTSINIGNSVTAIGNATFSECTGLTSIVIPNSVASIGNDAFYNCRGLTSIDIPNSVTEIGDRAFAYCTGLTSIDIPNSVTSIADWAFYRCTRLMNVYCYIADLSRVSCGRDQFSLANGDYSGRTLHVLQGMADAYRADGNWYPYFGQIVDDLMPALPGDINGDREVNIADVNVVIDIILNGYGNPSADVNGDREITIADINAVVDIILNAASN